MGVHVVLGALVPLVDLGHVCLGRAAEPGGPRRFPRVAVPLGQRGDAGRPHVALQHVEDGGQPPVATGAEQVGAQRGRGHPHAQGGTDVLLVDAGGEAHLHRAVVAVHLEGARHGVEQVVQQAGGEHVQRRSRHVHGVVGEEVAVVVHHHGVGQLHPEATAGGGRVLLQVGDEVHRPADLQVLHERQPVEADGLVGQVPLQDLHHPGEAEQRGVELDDHVEAVAIHEVLDDRLDLVGGAAVERRQGERVGDPGGEVVIAPGGERLGDEGPQPLDLRRGVQQ